MNALELCNLTRTFKVRETSQSFSDGILKTFKPSYKTINAVNDISLTVDKGEVVAFLGPNGAGKSTTIKMLTGILTPDHGSVKVLGLSPIHDRKNLAYKIGTVFGQKSQLWFHLAPSQSFQLLGAMYALDKQDFLKRQEDLIERFSLKDYFDTPVRKLSLGQRIRCELAASLIHKPEILFLDEPTIGLDIVVKQEIRNLLSELNKEDNVTIFLTSHDIGDIEKICKRAIIIHHGQLVVDEKMKELKHKALSKKIVSVKYETSTSINFPEINAEKQTNDAYKFVLDTKTHNLSLFMEKLIHAGPIRDITIEDEPLETLIADIYRSKNKEEAHEKAGKSL